MDVCTSTILLLVVFVLTFLLIYIKRAHEVFKRHGIPGPKPTRLFGIFPEYRKKGVAQTDIELTSKYGSVVGIYHGHRPVLLVSDLDMIEEICIKKFEKFRNRKVNLDLGPLLRKTVALSNNGQWRYLRDHISEIFNPKCLKQISKKISQSTGHLVTNIEEKLKHEKDFDFHELCLSFSVDSLCNSLFGYNTNSYKDKDDILVYMIKKGWSAGTVGIARPALACAIFPALMTVFSKCQYDAIPSDVRDYLTKLVTKHMMKRHTEGDQNDMLSFIMGACRRNSVVDNQNNAARTANNMSSSYRLSETEIVANCLFFFLAGYDTTASTLVFTLYCLAKQPDCQDRLVKEINNNISNVHSLDDEDVNSLEYLDMVLNESMRVFPTYLRFGRAIEEDVIIKGTQFSKGSEVSFPIYAIHRNPDIYPEPDKFDPDRFTEQNISKRHPLAFIPFGVGKRNCFPQTYAKLTIKMTLVSLLHKFKFSLSNAQKDPPELSKGFYLRPEKGLWLNVDKRIDNI